MRNYPPDDEVDAIGDLLSGVRRAGKLSGSKWRESCLAANYQANHPGESPNQALQAVLKNTLEELGKEEPDYASILEGRYWDGVKIDTMAKRRSQSRRNFLYQQKQAICEFARLLTEDEQRCKQASAEASATPTGMVTPLLQDAVVSTVEEPNPAVTNKPRKYNQVIVLTLTAGLMVAVVGLWLTRSADRPPGSGVKTGQLQISESPTATSTQPPTTKASALKLTATPTFSSTIPLDKPEEELPCGAAVMPLPDAIRLLRSQGLSAFTPQNTNDLILSNRVRSLAIDKRGGWLGYYLTSTTSGTGLGLLRRDQTEPSKWAAVDCNRLGSTAGQNVNALALGPDGRLWLALEQNNVPGKGGVAMWDGQTWHRYTTKDGLPTDDTFGITVDTDGNVWVATWEGIARLNGNHWDVVYSVEGNTLRSNHSHAIAFSAEGGIWVAHTKTLGNGGVSHCCNEQGQWVQYLTSNSPIAGDDVHTFLVRPAQNGEPEQVWIGTVDGGLSVVAGGKWTTYNQASGLPSNRVEGLALDHYGRVWAATEGGVVYLDKNEWRTYSTLNSFAVAFGPACTGCPVDQDQVLTATNNQGVTHSRLPYDREAVTVIATPAPIVVAPGEKFRRSIVIAPRPGFSLSEKRGDMLLNTDSDDALLFDSEEHMKVKGEISAGQEHAFSNVNVPFVAPELPVGAGEQTYTSTWRIWMHTRFASEPIKIVVTVRRQK